jgi:hypothetical protein
MINVTDGANVNMGFIPLEGFFCHRYLFFNNWCYKIVKIEIGRRPCRTPALAGALMGEAAPVRPYAPPCFPPGAFRTASC